MPICWSLKLVVDEALGQGQGRRRAGGEVEASRSRGDEDRGVADCGRLGFWPSGLLGWGDGWLEYLFDWSGDGPSWALGARWEIGRMGVPVGQEGFPVKYRRKLPGKYDKTRKRSERGKIVFVIVSVFFYRYRFRFFGYRYRFRFL